MTLEDTQAAVARAVAALDDPETDRAVRANAAYGFLARVAHQRHDLPDALRPQFETLWAAFHRAEPRIAEVLANRARFSLFSEEEFAACAAGARAFAAAIDQEIARTGTAAEPAPAAAQPDVSEESSGRAAAED